jgi:CheY-like chemotaxis protein
MRVLVVEDETESREQLMELLRLRRFEVAAARDGGAALDVLRDFRPDVILLDLAMPNMGGDELVTYVRDDPTLKDTALIVMSGWARNITPPVPVDGWLPKPIDVRELFALLDQISSSHPSGAATAG